MMPVSAQTTKAANASIPSGGMRRQNLPSTCSRLFIVESDAQCRTGLVQLESQWLQASPCGTAQNFAARVEPGTVTGTYNLAAFCPVDPAAQVRAGGRKDRESFAAGDHDGAVIESNPIACGQRNGQ